MGKVLKTVDETLMLLNDPQLASQAGRQTLNEDYYFGNGISVNNNLRGFNFSCVCMAYFCIFILVEHLLRVSSVV